MKFQSDEEIDPLLSNNSSPTKKDNSTKVSILVGAFLLSITVLVVFSFYQRNDSSVYRLRTNLEIHSNDIDYEGLTGRSPWGIYRARDYSNGYLKEARNNGRNAKCTNVASSVSAIGNGASVKVEILSGVGNSQIIWPLGSIAKGGRSACFATRYSGSRRHRILTGSNANVCNFLLGHWEGRTGVVYDTAWVNAHSVGNPSNWVAACYSNDEANPGNLIVNGEKVGKSFGLETYPHDCSLSINAMGSEQSDFEFAELAIWDTYLSEDDLMSVSQKLMQKFSPSYTLSPTASPVAKQSVLIDYDKVSGVPAWGVYRAADYSDGTLPEARKNGRDVKTSGIIEKKYSSLEGGATVPVEILRGNVRSKMIWPSGSISKNERTFCFMTRYLGPNNNRVLASTNANACNVVYGHWAGRQGVVLENSWVNSVASTKSATDWIVSCFSSSETVPNNILVNGKAVGAGLGVEKFNADCSMGINAMGSEQSDFEFAELAIWDKGLSLEAMTRVSDLMMQKLDPKRPLSPSMTISSSAKKSVSIDYDKVSGIPAWGVYRAADYSDGTLPEARKNGRDVKTSGIIVKKYSSLEGGATVPVEILRGNIRSKMIWPLGSISKNERTFCSMTRYSGTNNNRILAATNPGVCNVVYGHWAGRQGVVLENSWVNHRASTGTATDWIVSCFSSGETVPNNLLVNGKHVGTGLGVEHFSSDCIMSVNGMGSEESDFEFAELAIWDKGLSLEAMTRISDLMMQKLDPKRPLSPPTTIPSDAKESVLIDYDKVSGIPAWGVYRAADYSDGTLPEARKNGRNVKTSGIIEKKYSSLESGAKVPVPILRGNVRSKMIWPMGSISKNERTICSMTRYSGTNNNRLLTGTNPGVCNVVYGHWSGRQGVVLENSWVNHRASTSFATDWIVSCFSSGEIVPNNLLVNGKHVGTGLGVEHFSSDCIMSVNGMGSEESDFEFAELAIWDKALSVEAMTRISDLMMQKLDPQRPVSPLPDAPSDAEEIVFIDYDKVSGVPAWGVYRAADYTLGTLREARKNGRDVKTTGAIEKKYSLGHEAKVPVEILRGTIRTQMIWPMGSISKNERTICSMTRYSGTNNNRLLTGTNPGICNVVYGHWAGRQGVVLENSWVNSIPSTKAVTDWIVSCFSSGETVPNNLVVNGKRVGAGLGVDRFSSDCIMSVNGMGSEESDFEFAELAIWDKALSIDTMVEISDLMMQMLDPKRPLTPPPQTYDNVPSTIDYDSLTSVPAWGIYRASDFNNGILPEARKNGRDATSSGVINKIYEAPGNGATFALQVLKGNPRSKIIWPKGSISESERTVCAITRYSGNNKHRILTGSNPNVCNFIIGHWEGRRGILYDNAWSNLNSIGNVNNWLVECYSSKESSTSGLLVDGALSGTGMKTKYSSDCSLSINGMSSEQSDFELFEVAVWDKALSGAELRTLSMNMVDMISPRVWPSPSPTPLPTTKSTIAPTNAPIAPSTLPTLQPTFKPTHRPTPSPIIEETLPPTFKPIHRPTPSPTIEDKNSCAFTYVKGETPAAVHTGCILLADKDINFIKDGETSFAAYLCNSQQFGAKDLFEYDLLGSAGNAITTIIPGLSTEVSFYTGKNFDGPMYTFTPKYHYELTNFHFPYSKIGNDGIQSIQVSSSSSKVKLPNVCFTHKRLTRSEGGFKH